LQRWGSKVAGFGNHTVNSTAKLLVAVVQRIGGSDPYAQIPSANRVEWLGGGRWGTVRCGRRLNHSASGARRLNRSRAAVNAAGHTPNGATPNGATPFRLQVINYLELREVAAGSPVMLV
jgi:hypothetical protein